METLNERRAGRKAAAAVLAALRESNRAANSVWIPKRRVADFAAASDGSDKQCFLRSGLESPRNSLTKSAKVTDEIVRSEPIRLLVVDNHPLLIEGLTAVMDNQPDMLPVGQAGNGQEAIRLFSECRPDVTIIDLRLSDMSGIDVMIAIRSRFPEARFIILTTFAGDAEIQRALEAGARAYLLKTMPPQELMDVIRQVHAGRKSIPSEIAAQWAEHCSDERLTEREIDILRQVAGGNRNRDIADKLSISEETVKVHLKHIMEKLGANDRTQAVTIAARRGIIHL